MSQRQKFPFWMLLSAVLGGWAIVELYRERKKAENHHFFEGKVVVLTGSSRGIGRSLAMEFARRGSNLVLAARNAEDLQAVASECEAMNSGISALAVPTDVTDRAQLQALVKRAHERFGTIDILVNNAGIRQGGALTDLDAGTIRDVIEVNLMAAINLSHLVLPEMLTRGSGNIVNIASSAGHVAEPYFVPYGASKHGLVGFSDGLRREVKDRGVSVLSVKPGFVATDMVTHIGPAYERMGFSMQPVESLTRHIVDAIITGQPYVRTGLLETFAGYLGMIAPWTIDLFLKVMMPRDFAEKAALQRTD